ncbi:YiiX/YebB-like N1pC/P60 family cysteine hydrolase [Neolewinella lacunae]|uniref:Uncharacterized protein n=1 Tax=Neolewinella lacunae TaxID=1517758 RepID=A0A923PL65_9BACT|nr:YiiX/YebB-like N1pC/P60 family cysteine hydrolase [Neolewinella lacunae]MBC6994731.1 hypothetical protein [Neolewinella lacunae]MDN3634603.1 YiiX/YebB-like N1pC/P60 family cysteine hydrolase [Neolewinella lacunae]
MENRPGEHQVMLLLLLLFMCLGCNASSKNFPPPTTPHQGFALENLQAGDIICRMGKGYFSNLFRQVSQRDDRFSHAGIIYHRASFTSAKDNSDMDTSSFSTQLPAGYYVVHAEADETTGVGGVKIELIDSFLHHSVHWSIFRVAAAEVSQRAIAHRAYLHYDCETPFDLKFNARDTAAFYCTEFVAHCVNTVMNKQLIQAQTKFGGHWVIAPDDVYAAPEIKEIYTFHSSH